MKRWILRIIDRLGYVLMQKKAWQDRTLETKVLEIKQEWLSDTKIIKSREDVLHYLPAADTIAELGVGYGDFSKLLLQHFRPSIYVAIDNYAASASAKWGAPLQKHNLTHLAYFQKQVTPFLGEAKLQVVQGNSWDGLSDFEDAYFDYIYIDADHTYSSVKKDIESAKHKVKVEGILQCNDFTFYDTDNFVHYGVPRAVFELLAEKEYKLLYLCMEPSGYYDVVLQRIR